MNLPDVTLVMIETRQHDLALLAVKDCLAKVQFGDVLIFTDKSSFFSSQLDNVRVIEVPDWPTKIGWSRWLWSGVAPYLRTAYMLAIQWDAWIVNAESWDNDFYCYDYIGAPWWYKDNRNVGNGGFSLRSTRLMRYLRANRDRFPCTTDVDDDLMCRKYRPRLEEIGFVWAPEPVAYKFAFECTRAEIPTFGFHAMYNWGYVLPHGELVERVVIARESPYIYGSWMWDQLLKRNPELGIQSNQGEVSAA